MITQTQIVEAIELRFIEDTIAVKTRIQIYDDVRLISEKSSVAVYDRSTQSDFLTAVPTGSSYIPLIGWDKPAATPPAPIFTATPRQIRLALNQAGLRDTIEQAVAASSQEVRDTWQYAQIIIRTDPIIAMMAAALNIDDATIDQLFVTAATF